MWFLWVYYAGQKQQTFKISTSLTSWFYPYSASICSLQPLSKIAQLYDDKLSYLKREGEKEKTKETEQQNPGTLGAEKHFLKSFNMGAVPCESFE